MNYIRLVRIAIKNKSSIRILRQSIAIVNGSKKVKRMSKLVAIIEFYYRISIYIYIIAVIIVVMIWSL